MLVLISAAFAIAVFDSGSSCFTGGETVFSVPTPDAADVPLDVQPAFVYTENSCGSLDASLVLTNAEDKELASATVDVNEGLGELDPGNALAPSSPFVFTSTTFVSEVTIGFTTGTAASTPTGIVPTVDALTATWVDDPAQLELTADVSYSGAGGADLIAQWIDGPEGDVTQSTFTRVGAPGLTDDAAWVSRVSRSEAPKTWCLVAKTREINGDWTQGESKCVDVESASVCGCESGRGVLASAGVVIAGLAVLRRRTP